MCHRFSDMVLGGISFGISSRPDTNAGGLCTDTFLIVFGQGFASGTEGVVGVYHGSVLRSASG
jgi:hypothetical protein